MPPVSRTLLHISLLCVAWVHTEPHDDHHEFHPTHRPVRTLTIGHPHWPPYHPPKPTRPDPTRPDPTRPDPTRPDPTRPDPTRPDPTSPMTLKPTAPVDPHYKGVFHQVCTELNVTGYWKRIPFVGNILQVTLIDCDCNRYESNLTNFWITAPFDACGSVIESHNHVIVQKNSATVKVINVTNNIIKREHVYKYNMQCVFPRKKNLSLAEYNAVYNVTDGYTKEINTTKLKEFKVKIAVYDSSTYVREALIPVKVSTNQPIYIGIKKVTENKNLKMVVQQCFATPSPHWHDTTSYIFYHNKCPLDPTFKVLSFNDHEFNFVIKAFKFIKISRVVYIHCRIYICKSNATSPLCDQTCSYRKRRDVDPRLYDPVSVPFSSTINHKPTHLYSRGRRLGARHQRRRRALGGGRYHSDSSELEEIRYITSTRILYGKRHSCANTVCPERSTCVDLYPAVCICEKDYVLKFDTHTCENERILKVKGLHLNKTWMDAYRDPESTEFRHLAYKTEVEMRRLFRALYIPEIEGVKITDARNGSIILDFDLIVAETASEMKTYQNLVKAILVGNKTGMKWFRQMDILTDRLPTPSVVSTNRNLKDTIALLIEIAIPCSFVVLVVLLLLLYKQCKSTAAKKKVMAKYEVKDGGAPAPPHLWGFQDGDFFDVGAGAQNGGFVVEAWDKVNLPPESTPRRTGGGGGGGGGVSCDRPKKTSWDEGCVEVLM